MAEDAVVSSTSDSVFSLPSDEALMLYDFFLWCVDSFVFVILFILALRYKTFFSSFLVMGVAFMYGGITHRGSEELLKYRYTEYRDIVLMVWYLGMPCGLLLSMRLIKVLHQIFEVEYRILAKVYLRAYLLLSIIILITYFDVITLDSGKFDVFYNWGIPLINTVTGAVGLILTMFAVWHHIRKTEVRWPICRL